MRTRLRNTVTAMILAVFAWCPLIRAQSMTEEQSKQIDALFAKWDHSDSPGCTLAVMKGGKIIYKHAYGMANLDHDVILTTDTPFHVASVSKQFTAASIVLLEQERKLSFDDEVRKFIPELPDFGAKITIRHLLHHTSGLRDQWDLLGLAGWRYSLDLITNDDVLSVVTRQKALNFPPGSEYTYSNTGYTLLGEIVKRVSGKTLREFTTERIFEPLGMKNSHFRDDHAEVIKHQAYGYATGNKGGWKLSTTNFDTVGATSLFTTVEDLALWDENFYTGKVGGPHFTETMLHHDPLTNGENIPYAFGLSTDKYRGLDVVDHGGADAGYRSDLIRFPQQHFSVACLCNAGGAAAPGTLAKKVADILLATELAPQATDQKASEQFITLSAEQAKARAGFFLEIRTDQIWKLAAKETELSLVFGDDATPLHPYTADRFRIAQYPVEVRFSLGKDGLLEMEVGTPGEKMSSYRQLAPYTLPEDGKPGYVGNYRSEEIDPVYRITEENGKLVLKRLKHKPETLEAVAPDMFRAEVGTLRFKRDASRNISGVLLTTGRIRNLEFRKEK